MQTMFGNPNQQCAAALIAILPLLIVYIVFQRFFIEGITVGGGKE
jgi:ABC-type glycerol-3-phosphate transport system permease component